MPLAQLREDVRALYSQVAYLDAHCDQLQQQVKLQFDRLPLACIRIAADGRVLDWNPTAEKTFGYTQEEALGRPCVDLIVPLPLSDDLQKLIDRIRAGDMEAHSVNENRTKDGRLITCSWFNTPLMDSDGKFTGAVSLAEDITERTRVEAALRASERRFRSLALATAQVVWTTDTRGAAAGAEATWIEFTGQTQAEVLAGEWHKAVHPADAERVVNLWARAVETRKPYHAEYRLRRRDGAYRDVVVRGVPVVGDDGVVVEWVGTITDVTERAELDRQIRESSERQEVLSRQLMTTQERERAHLARELHDELGQVLAAANLHLHSAKGLAGAAALPGLEKCGLLLQQVGEQVRNLALELRPTMLEVLGLEAAINWLVSRYQPQTGWAVEVISHGVGPELSPDLAIACFRVIQEALTNIVRHANARHVSIELCQIEGLLELIVRDDGVGFEVPSTLGSQALGTHMGLLGMTERVRLLGGRMIVDSAPGRGTRIFTCFPLTAGPAPPPVPAEQVQ